MSRRVAVLAYHKIGAPAAGGWDTCHYLPVDVFTRQLEVLRDDNWAVIDAAAFVAGLTAPERLPERAALITFDDAHISAFRDALPVLREFALPAVCFVPTAYVGKTNSYDQGMEPEEPLCTWEQLLELERHGVSIQSHSVSHPWLSLRTADGRRHELVASRQVLEERLGRPVELFAYPYADACLPAGGMDAEVAAAGYRASFLCGRDALTAVPIDAPHRIARLAMYRETDLRAALAGAGASAGEA